MLPPAAWAVEAEYRFERVGVDDGLSQASVRALSSDRRGFLWFGTQEGLNRYDGYGILAYRHDPDDPQSLADNNIGSLHQDAAGRLWIGTLNGGLNRFDPASGRFQRYLPQAGSPTTMPDPWVRAALSDPAGRVWAATGNGLARLQDARVTVFRHHPEQPDSLSHNVLRSLHVDAGGRLWIGTEGGGLNRHDPGAEGFVRYRAPASAGAGRLGHDFIFAIASDRQGRLWIGTEGAGLDRLDPDNGQWQPVRPPRGGDLLGHAPITALQFDRQDRLWIATRGGGVGVLSGDRQHLHWLRHEPGNRHSLSHNTVWSLHEDAAGTLWIGTAEGVSRWHPRSRQFGHYRRRDGEPDSLSHDWVRSFLEDSAGRLWIGTQEGLNRWDAEGRRFVHYRHDWAGAESRQRDHIRALAERPDGRLWLGSDAGLEWFDPASGKRAAVDLTLPGEAATADRVATLYVDHDRSLWIGTHEDGLIHLREGSAPQRFRRRPEDPQSLSHNQVRVFHRDRRGQLWLGTWGGGLCRLQEASARFDCYRHRPGDSHSLANDVVRAIHEDVEGQLWLATQGGGLLRFDPASGRSRAYGRADGLADDSLYGILADRQGRLWISHNHGLSRFEPASGRVRNYTVRDGLQSSEFNTGAYYLTAAGEMLFGGIGGFNRFFPEQIEDNPVAPPVVFTELRLANRPQLPGRGQPGWALERPIEVLEALTLGHRQRQFSLEFAALDYSDPARNRYAYRLQGFDPDWVETDHRNRRATYTNLPPGHYRLEVRASNPHGVWNQDPAALTIHILPAPWQTWWARLGYFLLAGVLAAALLRWREARVRHQAAALQALVDQRTAELEQASLSDPLTGLGNRRLLVQGLQRQVAASGRDGRPARRWALLLLDLDHFKAVNDSYGHGAGDAVLVAVAKLIRRHCREGDLAGRWGGEEFLLVLAVDDETAAAVAAERLRAAVAATPVTLEDGSRLSVNCSIGFACLPFEPSQPQRLGWERVLAIADGALYLAKQEGRNRVVGLASTGPLAADFELQLSGTLDEQVKAGRLRRLTPMPQ